MLWLSSLPSELQHTGLDFFRAEVVLPPMMTIQDAGVLPPLMAYSMTPVMTRTLRNQQFSRVSDNILDKMYRDQTMIGLPRVPPPRYTYACHICSFDKLPQFRKGNTASTENIQPG
jgi:hypothetical protein